ncbi:MAG: ABC transporter ATP-binding protein [Actinomycetes bacterium]|jgi:branched-chain amino acid transport system ATP-binding protein|nr:ABC transporter ATP-binding protein [Acidimicrobiia bacterium]
MSVLEIEALNVWRGEAHVLHGVDLSVEPNGVTALLGRNGVGKTTTLLAVMGLLPATGSIRVDGEEVIGTPSHLIAQRGIGYVPEDREVFSALTVAENLRLAERPGVEHRYDLVYELFPDLASRPNQPAGTLSGGQQQMLAIARALLNPNRLLLIDEPTKGLAPIVVESVVEALVKATADTAVLLVEQNLWVAAELASRAVVIDEGKTVYAGDMDTLAGDPQLAGRYLGVEVR